MDTSSQSDSEPESSSDEYVDYSDCVQIVPIFGTAHDAPVDEHLDEEDEIIVFKTQGIASSNPKYRSVGKMNKLSYKMVRYDSKLVKVILNSYGFSQAPLLSQSFNVMWTGSHLRPYCLRSLTPYQRVNHFPRSYELTRKDRLYRNIERMKRLRGGWHFHFIPEFHVTPSEYESFKDSFYRVRGLWIVKPVGSSRGRGIFLATNADDIPLFAPMLISKYISNPLLFTGHKFDIRLYVAVTSFHPLVVYLYQEGLTRFASEKYNNASRTMDDQYIHLTNYSINKKSHRYERSEDPTVDNEGHKWSLSALLKELSAIGIDTQLIMLRIEDLVIKTLMSAQSSISAACLTFVPYDGNCFEVFGFDVLLSDDLRPWLLEVNLSPSLSCDAPLDFKIKSQMVCDLFSLAGITTQTPPDDPGESGNISRSVSQSRLLSSMVHNQPGNKKKDKTGKSVPRTREMSSSERVERLAVRLRFERKRAGAFYRIFPSESSWMIYGDLLEPLKPNLDKLLHQSLFPEMHEEKHDEYDIDRLREYIASTEVKSVFHISRSCLDLIPDTLTRTLKYQKTTSASSVKQISLPRLKKFQRISHHSLRPPDRDGSFISPDYRDHLCGGRELSFIYGPRPRTAQSLKGAASRKSSGRSKTKIQREQSVPRTSSNLHRVRLPPIDETKSTRSRRSASSRRAKSEKRHRSESKGYRSNDGGSDDDDVGSPHDGTPSSSLSQLSSDPDSPQLRHLYPG